MDAFVIIAIVVAVWLALAVAVALLFGRIIRRRNLEDRHLAPVEPSERAREYNTSPSFTPDDVAILSRILAGHERR